MVVSDAQAWHELAIQPSKIILIPTFDNPDIGLAMGNGHGVIRPVIEMDSSRDDSDVVTLLKVDRWAGATALARSGLDFLKADKLTALARRSMCRFYSIRPEVVLTGRKTKRLLTFWLHWSWSARGKSVTRVTWI